MLKLSEIFGTTEESVVNGKWPNSQNMGAMLTMAIIKRASGKLK